MEEVFDNDDISCGDVSGEDVSGGESESVDSDPGPYDDEMNDNGIKPYQFEPRADACEGGGEKVVSAAGKEAYLHDISLWLVKLYNYFNWKHDTLQILLTRSTIPGSVAQCTII